MAIARGRPTPSDAAPRIAPNQGNEAERAWRGCHEEVAQSSNGTPLVAEGSGCMIHREQPDLVAAIRELVETAWT